MCGASYPYLLSRLSDAKLLQELSSIDSTTLCTNESDTDSAHVTAQAIQERPEVSERRTRRHTDTALKPRAAAYPREALTSC